MNCHYTSLLSERNGGNPILTEPLANQENITQSIPKELVRTETPVSSTGAVNIVDVIGSTKNVLFWCLVTFYICFSSLYLPVGSTTIVRPKVKIEH